MRSEVLALVAAAGTDAALLFYAFSHFELFFVLFFGIIVAGGPFLGITFLPKHPVGGVRAEPGAAVAHLANRLRLVGSRVGESAGRVTVRIGSFSANLRTARPTLSEAPRSAAEATEALRSNYWDLQAIVIGGAIIVWLFAFILFSMDVNGDFTARMTMGAARATAAVAAAAIPLGILIRVRLRPN